MNDRSIRSKRHLIIWIGGVSLTNWLVSFLDAIFIHCDTKIMYALSPYTSNHSQIEWTTVVSVVNDIYVFAKVEYHLPGLHQLYNPSHLKI
jgi:hypothetical protein